MHLVLPSTPGVRQEEMEALWGSFSRRLQPERLARLLEEEQAALLRNQRLNLYGNLGLAGPQGTSANPVYAHSASNSLGNEASANLAMSMGVNIGSYGYQNGRGNLLQ